MLLWGTGWDGSHVHEFIFGHDHYGAKELGLDFPDAADEQGVTLSQALGSRKTFLLTCPLPPCQEFGRSPG